MTSGLGFKDCEITIIKINYKKVPLKLMLSTATTKTQV
ncbi:hypothetical protein BH09BAC3_BH09BAC3_03530 [soil metagenome]